MSQLARRSVLFFDQCLLILSPRRGTVQISLPQEMNFEEIPSEEGCPKGGVGAWGTLWVLSYLWAI